MYVIAYMDELHNFEERSYADYSKKLRLASLAQRLFICAWKVETLNVLQELIGERHLSNDGIRLYYLFIDTYLTPGVHEKHHAAFYSRKHLLELLAEGAKNLKKKTGEIFIPTSYNQFWATFEELVDAGLVGLELTSREVERYPKLFENVKLDRRKKTWSKRTWQPTDFILKGRDYLTVPSFGPIELESQPIAQDDLRPTVKDILEEFLLGKLFSSTENRLINQRIQWYYQSIIDNPLSIHIEHSVLTWLNGLGISDDDIIVFTYLLEPGEQRGENMAMAALEKERGPDHLESERANPRIMWDLLERDRRKRGDKEQEIIERQFKKKTGDRHEKGKKDK